MSRRKVMTGDDGTEYHLGEPIGHGAFSTVYYCRAAVTNLECAVKVYNRAALRSDPVQSRVFDNEVEALRSIPQSPAIANKIAIYNSSRNCYILLEYCKGGNLFNRIVKSGMDGLPDNLVRRWFQQLVAGLRDVHRAGFAHRDIKPENLLIDAANDLKVSDFGFATRCGETTVLEEDCGTARYVAPEVLQRSYNGLVADIWSVGVTLFVMLTGRLPFVATRQEDLYRKIAAGVLPALPATVCPAAEHLLRSCLQVDPSKRMSLRRLANHPYCRGYETMNVRLSRPVGGAGPAGDATTSGVVGSDPATTLSVAAPSASYTSLRDRTMRSLPQGEVAAWRTHEGRTRELQRMNLPPPPTPVDRKVVRTLSGGGASEALLPPSSARSPAVEAQTPLDRASALDGRCSSSKSPHPISPRPQRSPAGTPGARGSRETPVSPATSGSTAATRMGETPSILRRLGFVHARMVLRFALVVAQLLIAGIARLLFNVRLERQVDFPRPVQRLLERFFEPPASEAPDERGPNGWKLGATTPRHVASTPSAMSPQRQAVSPQSDNSALKKQSQYR